MCLFKIYVHLLVVMLPKVSVSALTRHVKDCEGKTKKKREGSWAILIKLKIIPWINLCHVIQCGHTVILKKGVFIMF